MASPQRQSKTPPQRSSSGGRRALVIVVGVILVVAGVVLMARHYADDNTKFSIGLGLAVVGGLAAFIAAVRQDRSSPRARNGDKRT